MPTLSTAEIAARFDFGADFEDFDPGYLVLDGPSVYGKFRLETSFNMDEFFNRHFDTIGPNAEMIEFELAGGFRLIWPRTPQVQPHDRFFKNRIIAPARSTNDVALMIFDGPGIHGCFQMELTFEMEVLFKENPYKFHFDLGDGLSFAGFRIQRPQPSFSTECPED